MADFCSQCSLVMFGTDYKELAELSKPEDTERKMYASAICEGCGLIQVDHTGRCISKDCLVDHEAQMAHYTDRKDNAELARTNQNTEDDIEL